MRLKQEEPCPSVQFSYFLLEHRNIIIANYSKVPSMFDACLDTNLLLAFIGYNLGIFGWNRREVTFIHIIHILLRKQNLIILFNNKSKYFLFALAAEVDSGNIRDNVALRLKKPFNQS